MSFNIVKISELSGVPVNYDLGHSDAMHATLGTAANSLSSIKITLGDLSNFFNTNSPWTSAGIGSESQVYLNADSPGSVGIGDIGDESLARLSVRGGLSAYGGLSATGGWNYFEDKVGIGTSSPSQKLQITGPNDTDHLSILLNSSSSTSQAVYGVEGNTGGTICTGTTARAAVMAATASGSFLQLGTSGAIRATIDNNGYVGIGISTPSEILHIRKDGAAVVAIKAQNATANSVMEYQAGNDADNWWFGIDGSDNFGISDATGQASQRLVITQSGNVGIGTTSPSYLLEVAGTIRSTAVNSNDFLASDGAAGSPSITFADDTDTGIYRSGSDKINITTGGTSRVIVNNAGNVGIGTTVPSQLLHLHSSTNPEIQFTDSTTGGTASDGARLGLSSDHFFIWQQEAKDIYFGTSATERMRIDSSGNVGIGTDSPSQKLHVAGKLMLDDSSDGYIYLGNDHDQYIKGDAGSNWMALFTANTERMRITSDGNVGIGNDASAGYKFKVTGTGYFSSTLYGEADIIAYYSSDERLKTDVTRITGALDKVNRIGGYTFKWTDSWLEGKPEEFYGPDHTEAGVIAQEVQEVLPEAVRERIDGYLGVQYDQLVPLLIESIKELTDRVKQLEDNNG